VLVVAMEDFASGWASSLYRSQRVYRDMISWEMVATRGREMFSSERNVIGSCCCWMGGMGAEGSEDELWRVDLRMVFVDDDDDDAVGGGADG
jgi:hypothetical protein